MHTQHINLTNTPNAQYICRLASKHTAVELASTKTPETQPHTVWRVSCARPAETSSCIYLVVVVVVVAAPPFVFFLCICSEQCSC